MPPVVIDGQVVEGRAASISVTDDGLLRGDGVFEVIRLYAGKPWALDEHLERMAVSARNLRLEISVAEFASDIDLLLAHVGPVDSFLRLVKTRGGRRISLIEGLGAAPASVALATVEFVPSPLMDAIKSLSYASNMLAARLACERDADDALFVTPDGVVLEASRASFFYVVGSALFTPPLKCGVLDSITRRHLFAVTGATERSTSRDDLDDVTEAFIASTTKEVLPVRAIDGRLLLEAPGPNTRAADLALSAHIHDHLGNVS
jgi:branched-chain amino acid aminotransferase